MINEYALDDPAYAKYTEKDTFIIDQMVDLVEVDHKDVLNSTFSVSWIGFPGHLSKYSVKQYIID